MLLVTAVVVLLPLVTSLVLRATGVLSSPWLSVALTVVLSLTASSAGSAYWRKRGDTGELLFSELLVWGWVRRWRQEREVANAARLLQLGVVPRPEHVSTLSTKRREQLLAQLAKALEGQDVYLNGHSRRVARHATMIARGLGLSNAEVTRIRVAAAVHDVGKVLTPKAVLNKPGRLTDAEFDVVKRHPVDGADMVAALGDHELTRIVRHHHERLDGAGYPDGLSGQQIPLGARIIAVADTFDAITSSRPYRAAARHQRAIDILRAEAGSQLDPGAVRAFLAYYSGNRRTAVWALAAATVRRVVSCLMGDPAAAATVSSGKLAAMTAATVAIGAAAGGVPVPVVHKAASRNAAHAAAVAHPTPSAAATLVPRSASAPGARSHAVRSPHPHPKRARLAAHPTRGHAADARSHAASHMARVIDHRMAPVSTPRRARASSPAATTVPAAPAAPATIVHTPPANAPARAPSPTTSSSAPSVQPTPTTNSGHNGNGNGHAHGQGNGSGKGNAPATTTETNPPVQTAAAVQPTTPTTTTATTTTTQSPGTGNGNGSANGQRNANGNGNAPGSANGQGNTNAPARTRGRARTRS